MRREWVPPSLPWPATDWDLWSFMQNATLREAALLSVGLEPRPVRLIESGCASPNFADPGPEFQRRMILASNQMSEHGPLRPLAVMELLGQPGNAHVKLSEFRVWAESMGWELPEKFPGSHRDASGVSTDQTDKFEERVFAAAFIESVANGETIDWRSWVELMPTLTAAQAARLMSALDPDVHRDLQMSPITNDTSELRRKAEKLERIATAQGRLFDSPQGWLQWAREHRFKVHVGFVLAVEGLVPVAEPVQAREAPKLRRARLLEMYEAEVAAGREFGALARITKKEKRTRPTADRSNIGKDIKKAREERDAERRGGALTSLLR